MNQPLLNLRDLSCGYPGHTVVQNLNLHLNAGDIGCLLGPSGCGKTTTLRAIAGFEPVLEGEIQLAEQVISKAGFTLAPEKRRIGMVFQDYALFPHLSVRQNVAFGLQKGWLNPRVGQRFDAVRPLDLAIERGDVFGLIGKGRIAAGYDADFTIVDLKKKWTVTEDWLQSRCGWSPFTGMELTGKPIGTIIRGHRVMWEDALADNAVGEPVRFEWHRRNKDGSLHWDEVCLKRANIGGVERILAFMTAHPDGFESFEHAAAEIAAYLPHRRQRKSPAQLAHLLKPREDGRLGWHWDPRLLAEFIPSTGDLQGAIEDACRGLDVPVLLVSGGRSDLVSDQTVGHFLELAPHAHHVRLPDATHMVAGDDNDAFADTLLSFLKDLTAPAAARTGDPR